jgi:hypothetical protein
MSALRKYIFSRNSTILSQSGGGGNSPTPIIIDGIEYNLVTNPITGKTWLDKDLGVTQVPTSLDYCSNAEAHLYQWGRSNDGHQIRTSDVLAVKSTTDTPGHGDFIGLPYDQNNPDASIDWRSTQNDNLWQGINGINLPSGTPEGFRLPTDSEWQAEIDSWSSPTIYGAFDSPLKLVMTNSRSSSGELLSIPGVNTNCTDGVWWSSTVSNYPPNPSLKISKALLIYNRPSPYDGNNGAVVSQITRIQGAAVRLILDDAYVNQNNTELLQ